MSRLNRTPRTVPVCLLLLFLFGLPTGRGHASAPSAAVHKIAPELLAPSSGVQEVLVVFEEQADLSGAAMLRTKQRKGSFVFQRLTEVAHRTQASLRQSLDARGVAYRSFWVVNMLRVEADLDEMMQIAQFPEVARIETDPPLNLEPLQFAAVRDAPQAAVTVEWNVARVGAPPVWNEGFTGQGAVVGSMDTGFEWSHPALQQQYRGYDRGIVDHNYNWHDAIHGNGGVCGPDSPEPCDEDGHGTLTMGTSVGDDGGANQIGVAPGARWIGCRCWEPVRRTYLSYVTECFEWFVAPTDLGDLHPDPGRAPDVINNSWICEWNEGCDDPLVMQQTVENVRAAGIVVVASAGNSGSLGCESITDPPAIYDAAFSVGSTDMQDNISPFSSLGPVATDGSGRMKPDIVAPGQSVRSSTLGGRYEAGVSGTSLSGPIVAGTVALILSAVPTLAGDVDAIESILIDSALPLTSSGECGGVPNTSRPNNTFGWGRVDAWAAVQLALSRQTSLDDDASQDAVDDVSGEFASRFRLLPNRPNPFNPATRLQYDIPRSAWVSLHLHDATGRRVRTLVPVQVLPAGRHEVLWDGRDDQGRAVASGVYFARLESGARVLAKRRLTLVR